LSDIELTENERASLSLGFSMSWPKENIDITVSKAEATLVYLFFSNSKIPKLFPLIKNSLLSVNFVPLSKLTLTKIKNLFTKS